MRKWTGLFPLVAVGIVVLAVSCQQRQEVEDEGAPVDTSPVAETEDTGTEMKRDTVTPGKAAGGEAEGGDQTALGKQVYEANCMTCHGGDGTGAGPAGAGLQPPPANFTDSEWKYGSDLASVKNTILNGVPGTAMIAWKGTLTDAEIDAVAKHEIAFSQGGQTASAR